MQTFAMSKPRKYQIAHILSLLLCILAARGASALSLTDTLPSLSIQETAALLQGKSIVFDAGNERQKSHFIPASQLTHFQQWHAERKNSEWYIGTLFLLKDIGFSEKEKLDLINSLSQIDTISGVTYYSETRKKTAVLFDHVYRVAEAGSYTALPNLQFAQLPKEFSFHAHFKDINFGSTWYFISVRNMGDSITLTLSNAAPLGYFVLRAFEKDGLAMHFVMVPVDEGILAIGLCSASPGKAASSVVDIYSAIEKRLQAVQGWVSKRAQSVQQARQAALPLRGSP